MITSVTFLASRHPTDRWYSCRTNQVSVEIDCYQVRRELSDYLEGDLTPQLRLRIEEHLRTCDHCTAVYDGLRNIVQLAGRRRGYRTARRLQPASVQTTASGLLSYVRLRPRHLLSLTSSIPCTNAPVRNLRVQRFFPVTSAKDWNHTARFHEWHRAQPAGRSAEPGGHADADAHSNRGVADAQTGRLGVSTSSLA